MLKDVFVLQAQCTFLLTVAISFQYFALRMQEVDLFCDEPLVERLLNFGGNIKSYFGTPADCPSDIQVLLKTGLQTSTAQQSAGVPNRCFYLELAHVHPIKANITFTRIPSDPTNVYVGFNPLRLIRDAMQRVDSVQLRLSSLSVRHVLQSSDILLTTISKHYERQLKENLLNVAMSLQVYILSTRHACILTEITKHVFFDVRKSETLLVYCEISWMAVVICSMSPGRVWYMVPRSSSEVWPEVPKAWRPTQSLV